MNQNLLWVEKLKFNNQDLIPAIAQDYRDGTVLMMAWMNSESIQKTLNQMVQLYGIGKVSNFLATIFKII